MLALPIVIAFSIVAGLLASSVIMKAVPPSSELDNSLVESPEHFYDRLVRSLGPRARRERAKTSASAFMPVLEAIGRLVPVTSETRARDREWLVNSGVKIVPQVFWAARVLGTLAGVLLGGYLVMLGSYTPAQSAAVLSTAIILGSQLPTIYVFMRRAGWRRELDRQLPDALDLMVVCISAGTSLDTALRVVSERMEGALPEAFADIVEESRYGSRSQALGEFAARTGVSSMQVFAASMAQAESTGSSLLAILREQADTARAMRRLTLEQRANALQVKILFPMLLFVFPILVIVVLAPMIPQMMSMFGAMAM